MERTGTSAADYRRLILAADREQFVEAYPLDIAPTTDDRPFFFHTTRLRDQLDVAFGRSMLFGNGLSALLTLMGISAMLVVLFIALPLFVGGGRPAAGWGRWLVYFGALGAGFMLLEVALLQRFVLLLGHPVYSLAVTLFSLLLGTGLGSLLSRRVRPERVKPAAMRALGAVMGLAFLSTVVLPQVIDLAIPWPLPLRVAVAAAILVPTGVLLGIPLPAGCGCCSHTPDHSVGLGLRRISSSATVACFIAMNWGFRSLCRRPRSSTRSSATLFVLMPGGSRAALGGYVGRVRRSRPAAWSCGT